MARTRVPSTFSRDSRGSGAGACCGLGCGWLCGGRGGAPRGGTVGLAVGDAAGLACVAGWTGAGCGGTVCACGRGPGAGAGCGWMFVGGVGPCGGGGAACEAGEDASGLGRACWRISSVMSRLSERTVAWRFATSTISTMSRTVMNISANIKESSIVTPSVWFDGNTARDWDGGTEAFVPRRERPGMRLEQSKGVPLGDASPPLS